ncbi:hypothetical protein N5938_16205 [Pseudomonas aeruginosa]|uniref:hypothetical protein n=1 Tax=Pseudomonas aeruginosa TaxID=287 RepID=UPI0021F24A0C|nr:hypothetical protein [Pseudomonas aeruginosa]UYM64344.1 hypothetical protein N5938_16205 [Pseudomonas aeruginosa]
MTQEKAYSFKSLRRDKAIKSRDLYRVRYSDLVVVPGNNERDKDERYWHSINALEKFLLGGGQVAPLEVEVNPKTGAIEIVQGHRRHEAFGRVIPAKQEQLRSLIREDMAAADKAKLLEKKLTTWSSSNASRSRATICKSSCASVRATSISRSRKWRPPDSTSGLRSSSA